MRWLATPSKPLGWLRLPPRANWEWPTPPPRATGVIRPLSKAKPKIFLGLALVGGQTTLGALGSGVDHPPKDRLEVAEATTIATRGGSATPYGHGGGRTTPNRPFGVASATSIAEMGWPATINYFIKTLKILLFLFSF
jgi:hypothetical protein